MDDNPANLGKTDDEVAMALQDMKAALWAMIEDADGFDHPRLDEVGSAVHNDIQVALCLDPKKIDEEYTRMRKAAFAVGEDADALVQLREASRHTQGWKGKAADAFREHMDRMESFAYHTQHTAILIALQSLGALFAMAYHMRQSYYDLAVLVESAAIHEVDEHQKRIDKVKLAMEKEFVSTALSKDPTKLVDFVVETAGALKEYEIEGDGVDAVIDSYLTGSKRLRDTFESELVQLTDRLSFEYDEQARMEGKLKALLPVNVASDGITDVSGPKFTYTEFYTEEYPRYGPFGGQVEQERKEYAAEQSQQQTEINKRLGGDS